MRRRLEGLPAVLSALSGNEPVRLVLAARSPENPEVEEACRAAGRAGAEVRRVGAPVLARFTSGPTPTEILALVGPSPGATLEEVLPRLGAIWLLAGLRHPVNVSFILRTAEVTGADAVVVDFGPAPGSWRKARKASMRADWFFPVFFRPAGDLLTAAAPTHRLVAVEDFGTKEPWEVDLTRPSVFVVGSERQGIPPAVLERCHEVIRIPMAGFIPSHNVQAAMAVVAVERLRQLGAGDGSGGAETPA